MRTDDDSAGIEKKKRFRNARENRDSIRLNTDEVYEKAYDDTSLRMSANNNNQKLKTDQRTKIS